MTKVTMSVGLCALTALLVMGCQKSESSGTVQASPGGDGSASGAAVLPSRIVGKVLQTLSAGRYIYIELESGSGSLWVAAVAEPVEKGDYVSCVQQTVMEGFESPILKRKFDRVYFVAQMVVTHAGGGMPSDHQHVGAAGMMPSNHPPVGAAGKMPPNHPPIGDKASKDGMGGSAAPEEVKIDVSPVEGGVTIAGLIAKAESLTGTEVLLRAKVTKFNANIMNVNWLHVRDGSDKRDLVVTTKSTVKVGDTVLVRGRPERDVDLGGGYRYDFIIRNADVTVEK